MGAVYTWVTNPAGVKYYYWYLKCPGKPVSLIYMGSEGGRVKQYRRAIEASRNATKAIEILGG